MTLALIALSTAAPRALSQEAVLPGRVLRVTDGDTVRVRLGSGLINVRLHAVDAPELAQPWGREARDRLARRLPAGRAVQLEVTDQSDGYGRMVARIFAEGEDLNAWMVRSGHAFVYRQYAEAADRDLCRLEHEARGAGRGLWGLPPSRRLAPWEWRRNKRGAPVHRRAAPRLRHQGQHQRQRPHLPPAGRRALRPYPHRQIARRALVLQRGRGARGRLAARALSLPVSP